MKSTTIFLAVVCTGLSAHAQLSPEITTWITDNGNATFHDIIYSNIQQVQYTESDVFLSCNGIPTYDIGPWDDPALGTNQNFVFKVTRNPVPASNPEATQLGRIGIWSNGLSIYNLQNGKSYRTKDVWHLDAVRAGEDGLAPCTGQAAEIGEYFTYTTPTCLFDFNQSNEHSPILGYAFDGYPIYGAYGYANNDGTGAIVRMRSGYQLRNISDRTTLPDGTPLPADLCGPVVDEQFPLGVYAEDYAFVEGSGDLDAHNGRWCVTPDYPNGTYAYFITYDASGTPQYPYVIGDTYYGKVAEGNIGEYSGHNIIDAEATTYTSVGADNSIEIMFYPNPTKDYFHVYIQPSFENNINATLTDITGRVVFAANNWQPGVNYPIDVRGMGSGMYFLRLSSGDAELIQKCIVR